MIKNRTSRDEALRKHLRDKVKGEIFKVKSELKGMSIRAEEVQRVVNEVEALETKSS